MYNFVSIQIKTTYKSGNKLAKEMTDELLKQTSMEDNKENRDC